MNGDITLEARWQLDSGKVLQFLVVLKSARASRFRALAVVTDIDSVEQTFSVLRNQPSDWHVYCSWWSRGTQAVRLCASVNCETVTVEDASVCVRGRHSDDL